MMSRDRGFDVPREMGLVSGFISDGEIVLCFTASFLAEISRLGEGLFDLVFVLAFARCHRISIVPGA